MNGPLHTSDLTHAPFFEVQNGTLCAGGQPLTRLAEVAGQTPLFVYDRAVMAHKVAALRAQLPPGISLHYAIKANPMPAVVGHMRGLVEGFDVASGREMHVALNAGMPAREISFAGPAKREPELRTAVAAGITLNVESFTELERIAAAARALNTEAHVALRVNPAFELKGAGMKMGGSPRQFGVDEADAGAWFIRARALDVNVRGLHIFGGSQNLDPDAIAECQQATLALAADLIAGNGIAPDFVNFGGGLGVPYFTGEKPLDLALVGERLGAPVAAFRARYPEVELVMELGRYLVAESGLYVTRVVDIKDSQGLRFAMTDGGLHHHLANSGNFGQVIRKDFPVCVANKADAAPADFAQRVVGPLCTPLDIVSDKVPLPPLGIGDLVTVFQSGAYGYTASPRDFLSHPDAIQLVV